MSVTSKEVNDDLKGIAAGVGFAAAYAWMDVFSRLFLDIIPLNKDSLEYIFIYALLATLMSLLVFYLIKSEGRRRRRAEENN